jgi:transcriptional regulator with XRE-family HTH domain
MVRKATPLFDALLARVSAATKRFGSKAKLARSLGVPAQQINDWLNGTYVPGGETALALLQWVEGAEAQQKKTPERALPRPGRRPKKRNLNEKKPSSGLA